MCGRAASLGRRTWIEDPEVLETLHLRNVGMAVEDRGAIRKARRKPSLAPDPRAGDMDHPDPDSFHVNDLLVGKRLLELGLVHVSVDALHPRPKRRELVEERARDEVAAVEDQIGAAQPAQALVRECARPTR